MRILLSVAGKITLYLKMIKFSHSVFALPFAFTGAILAAGGFPDIRQILWITVAMVCARSGAMGLNRIIDRKIDASNPRTKNREIPSGKIKLADAFVFTAAALAAFVFSAYMLNPLCLKLSPFVIAVLFLYSFTKRFTWASHLVLGVSLSFAPLGAWVAVRGTADIEIIPLGVVVIFWLAGFDILYALQDIEFDRSHGLYSVPQRFGIKKSLLFSRVFHIMAVIMLAVTGFVFNPGFFFWIGFMVVSGLFIYEHSIVKADDLSRLNMAFFNMNGYISMAVFFFTLLNYVVVR